MLPRSVTLLSYAGLIPFLLYPAWLTVSGDTAPQWLDHAWLVYAGMIAAFMAGTFWGFALPAIEGAEGQLGVVIAVALMLLTWGALSLPQPFALLALIVVFLLQLLADFWRERTLGEVEGYFRLRAILTIGACCALVWRLLV